MEDTGASTASTDAQTTENTEQNQESNEVVTPQEGGNAGGKTDSEKAVAEAIRKHKLKIDGEEVEVDDEELKRGYQLRKASDKRFQEAMQARKQTEEFVNLLRTNPMKILKDPRLGVDVKALAENLLAEEIEDQMLSPEQKELKEAKRKLAEYEEFKKQQQQAEEEQRSQYIREHYKQQYEQDIVTALQASNLPKTEHTVKRMAYYMAEAVKKGYDLSAKDVTDLVKQDYQNEIKSLFGATDGDTLLSMLGDDVSKKIRAADLKRVRNPVTGRTPESTGNRTTQQPKESKKMSMEEFRQKLRSIED